MLLARAPQRAREAEARRTDQDDAYTGVIPAERQKASTKPARQTKHIERFKNALRQRVSRLVRETLSFSKKLAHHIGALTYCMCHYNLMQYQGKMVCESMVRFPICTPARRLLACASNQWC